MSAGTRCSASHPILAIRSCFNLGGYSVGVVLCFFGFGPAGGTTIPAGTGGIRTQGIAPLLT